MGKIVCGALAPQLILILINLEFLSRFTLGWTYLQETHDIARQMKMCHMPTGPTVIIERGCDLSV